MFTGKELDIWRLIFEATPVVKGVLFLLLGLSMISWYIIAYKYLYLRRAQAESLEFIEVFWESRRLDAIYQASQKLRRSPVSKIFKAGYIELSKLKGAQEKGKEEARLGLEGIENVERALKRAATSEVTNLENMVPFLATTGSTAPFVGLFGTVWGIMHSFISIGIKGEANLAAVAPGIAEALIATAIGLLAAVPAVMAYNYFVRRIRVLSTEMDTFSNDFLNIIKRHFFK